MTEMGSRCAALVDAQSRILTSNNERDVSRCVEFRWHEIFSDVLFRPRITSEMESRCPLMAGARRKYSRSAELPDRARFEIKSQLLLDFSAKIFHLYRHLDIRDIVTD